MWVQEDVVYCSNEIVVWGQISDHLCMSGSRILCALHGQHVHQQLFGKRRAAKQLLMDVLAMKRAQVKIRLPDMQQIFGRIMEHEQVGSFRGD